jgi:ATP-binding cassette subfamily B protein
MENGRIVERGTHSELLALGGAYASLYAAQFQNESDARTEDDDAGTLVENKEAPSHTA